MKPTALLTEAEFRSHFNSLLGWICRKGDCAEAEAERDILFAAYRAALSLDRASPPCQGEGTSGGNRP